MKTLAAAATLLSIIATAASAAPQVDQSQADFGTAISSLGQPLVQTFTAGATNTAGAGVYIANAIGASTTLTIELWNALPSAPGAVQLAFASGTASSGAWMDVFFPAVPTTVGQTYVLAFTTAAGNGLAIMGSIENPYSGGQVFAGSTYNVGFPAYDFAFRTYTDVPAVPEPATALMFGLGAAALALAGARRRQRA